MKPTRYSACIWGRTSLPPLFRGLLGDHNSVRQQGFSKTSVFATSKMQVIGVAVSPLPTVVAAEKFLPRTRFWLVRTTAWRKNMPKEEHAKGDFPQADIWVPMAFKFSV